MNRPKPRRRGRPFIVRVSPGDPGFEARSVEPPSARVGRGATPGAALDDLTGHAPTGGHASVILDTGDA